MKNKNIQKIFSKYSNIIAPILIWIVALVVLYRNFISFCWSDESLYVATVHRIYNGERMFVDEWYTSQLSVPIMLPFYSLFRAINHDSTNGVYLYFRIVYWCISLLIVLYGYKTFKKKYSPYIVAAAMSIYLIYSRANIGGMSYYNMTLSMVLIAGIQLYSAWGTFNDGNSSFSDIAKNKCWTGKIETTFAGVGLAIAVVYNPYLILIYLVVIILALFVSGSQIKRKMVLLALIGSFCTAICYVGFLLSQCRVSDIINNIPHILEEPELQSTNPILAIPTMIVRIIWAYKYTIIIWLMLFAFLWVRKNKEKKFEHLNYKLISVDKVALIIDCIILVINCCIVMTPLGCINLSLFLFAIPIVFYFAEKKDVDWPLVYIFGIAGIGLSIAFTFSSDTGLDAMGIGFVPLAMLSILNLYNVNRFKPTLNRTFLVVFNQLVSVLIIGAIILSIVLRVLSVYRDAPLRECTDKIISGPAAGLFTTKMHKNEYDEICNDIQKYVRNKDIVLYSREGIWCCVCTDNNIGSYTTWRTWFDSKRFDEYYELNPDKIPTFIYVFSDETGAYESDIIQNNEKVENANMNNIDGYLYSYICDNDYEVIDTKNGTIFRSLAIE